MEPTFVELGLTVESSVYERYAAASREVQPALCCPVSYDAAFLQKIPEEILQKDYGCGDPSPFIRAGDMVLDLGSGGGKLCYIAAQVVGPTGRVIGVDCNPEMLALARRHQAEVARRIGYANVEFRYGMIQDLQLNLELLGQRLQQSAIRTPADWLAYRSIEDQLRREQPLVASDSIDCVVSNCVLNLVRRQDRQQLFAEIFRVLKPGGRAAISDIVCDEDVPESLQQDGELWSGCVSGAFREDRFLDAFAAAGFHGLQIARREAQPWRVVEGIEFRSMTVIAWKGTKKPRLDRNQALIYKGPFTRVEDDDGQIYLRGQRMAVCDRTFDQLQRGPYAGLFEPIEPSVPVSSEQAKEMSTMIAMLRNPRLTKSGDVGDTGCCSGSSCC